MDRAHNPSADSQLVALQEAAVASGGQAEHAGPAAVAQAEELRAAQHERKMLADEVQALTNELRSAQARSGLHGLRCCMNLRQGALAEKCERLRRSCALRSSRPACPGCPHVHLHASSLGSDVDVGLHGCLPARTGAASCAPCTRCVSASTLTIQRACSDGALRGHSCMQLLVA